MLILGIETATEQVSVALGGHEGVIGLFEVARGRRHAEILTPAIEFVCAQADIGLDEIGLVAVDVGPGPVHRHARRPGRRQGAGAGAARADDRDLVARPAGVPAPPLRPRRRARRSTPARARCSTPCTARCRAGCSRSAPPQVGPVDELVADLLARSQEALCVGDGALRYRAEILDGFHCEIADDAHPSAGPLVQLAHARALREEWVSPSDIRPLYLRQPDAQINWATRASADRLGRRVEEPTQ